MSAAGEIVRERRVRKLDGRYDDDELTALLLDEPA